MLRSWRSPIRIGIFPDRVWLAASRDRVLSAPVTHGSTPLLALAALLSDQRRHVRSAKALVLTSDQLALQALVPAQPLLRERSELQAYGRVSLDQAGLPPGATDVVNVVYRHLNAVGLALSYSTPWLAELAVTLSGHGLAPLRVLPVTCSVFAYARHGGGAGLSAVVLDECAAAGLLVWRSGRLIHVDAEPAQAGENASMRRLLARTKAQFEDIDAIRVWRANCDLDAQPDGQPGQLQELARQFYPGAPVAELATWAIMK